MRSFLVLCLLIFSLPVLGFEIPEEAPVKSATRSFNHQFEVKIIEGRIWHRPRPVRGTDAPPWELLAKTGLPEDASPRLFESGGFDSPSSVTELSTDGDNLIVTDKDHSVYYMKWGTRKWTHKWGMPFSKILKLPENIRSWSVSHRGLFTGGYNDIDGNFHPVAAGVTTLYVLSEDGLTIRYADPWLPADFSRQICGPLRNRFRARSLDASASTLFVIGDTGEMYTRLADYDTLGNNRFLAYSYERRKRDIPNQKDVRTLPPEGWKKQPDILKHQGRISSAITIIQTGKGNDSRELRVEGVNAQGVHGFFSKSINGETWSFTQTKLPLQKPLLPPDAGASDPGPDTDQTFSGHLRIGRLLQAEEYEAELKSFNPLCTGATLAVKIGNDELEFPFYTTASSNTARKMEGAFTITDEIKAKTVNNKRLEKFVKNLFGEKSFVEIKLSMDESDAINVQSHSLFSMFPKVNMEFLKGISRRK